MDKYLPIIRPKQISSPLSSAAPESIPDGDILGEDSHGSGRLCASLLPVESEVMPKKQSCRTGEGRPNGPPSPSFREVATGYTHVATDSSQTHALTQTLEELRELRDGMLREDEYSAAGPLLAQITLVFERIQRGVPSRRETFIAALRASQSTEPRPEAVEVTL